MTSLVTSEGVSIEADAQILTESHPLARAGAHVIVVQVDFSQHPQACDNASSE
jgi:hypothetical protein